MSSPFSGGRRLDLQTGRLLQQAAAFARDHPARAPARANGAVTGQPAAELRGVGAMSDGVAVLRDVDLVVPAGAITAVIGATGAAKGALVDALLGRRPPDTGEAFVVGRPTAGLSEDGRSQLALKVGVVLRDSGLFSSLSVADNIAFLLRHEGVMPEPQVEPIVADQLRELGLEDVAGVLPDDLGPGQRKLVALGRALAGDPAVVIFDEPEAGLDHDRRVLLTDLLGHLHARRPRAYLLLTQNVPMAVTLAGEIVLVHAGRIIARGSPDELAASPNPHVRTLITQLARDVGD